MNIRHWSFVLAAGVVVGSIPWANVVRAADVDCAACHPALTKGSAVHPAVQMGCPICHSAIDASAIPHKVTGKVAKGLSAEPAELCITCHDKAKFGKKVVHAALGMGCLACHNPHSSDQPGLLAKAPTQVCLDCHPGVKKQAHLVVGFSGGGHPLGDEMRPRPVADPIREGKGFSCASCHDPHSSDFPKLSRFNPREGMGLCQKCHQK